jgi:mycoredoxin
MTLTPLQTASLKRLQQYRVNPPNLRDRLRLSAAFMIALLLPMLLAGALMLWLQFPAGLFLLAGLYVGAVAHDVGAQRHFVQYWPLGREITDWNRVDQFLSGAEQLPPLPQQGTRPKARLGFAAALGIAGFAMLFGAALAAERTLAFAYNPTRHNPPHHVIVLSASWCGYCMSLRHHLTELKVPYTDLDTEHTTEGRWGLVAVHATGVPVTIVGEHVIRGLGTDDAPWAKVDAALIAAGYRLPSPTTHD